MRFKRKAENREWVIKRRGEQLKKNRTGPTEQDMDPVWSSLDSATSMLFYWQRGADEERERENFVLMSLGYFLCILLMSPVQESICLTVVVDVIESGDSRGFRREWDQNCVTIVLLFPLDPYPSTLQRTYKSLTKIPCIAWFEERNRVKNVKRTWGKSFYVNSCDWYSWT